MARKYMQGLYKPINPQKYKGNTKNIVYRSSWELSYLFKLDTDETVLRYSSEEIIIPYRDFTGKVRRYFPDMWYEKVVDGKLKQFLVEIKPHKETVPPVLTEGKKKTKTKIREVMTWDVNSRKWEAARKYCEKKGWEFEIVTEKNMPGLARKW